MKGMPEGADVPTDGEPDSSSTAEEGLDPPPARSRRGRLIAGLAVAAALVLLGLLLTGRVSAPSKASGGQGNAKDFNLENVRADQPRVELAAYRGRPVVLNFFASWCVPCRSEMPGFEAVHQQVGDRIAFIGIDHNDVRPDAIDLLNSTGVTYPSGFNPKGDLAVDYGLVGMPTTVFISADGRVLDQHTGALSQHDLSADIDRLFPGP